MVDKVSKKSVNGVSEKKEQLKSLFPEVFKEGKVDFEKLRKVLGDEVSFEDETYSFNWAGKQKAIRNIQTSSNGTLVPDKEESVDFDDSENLFIEGDNLEVLKLLQKGYSNSVKMVYIDPPYNTGGDFVYDDDYKEGMRNYLRKTGQVDDSGNKLSTNTETNGRYHSDWLSMMYPRLFLARNLLKEDGVIFISIDNNELHNLRKICNEIFGEENFLANVVWKHTQQSKNDELHFSRHYNSVIVYGKSVDDLPKFRFRRTEEDNKNYSNSDDDPKGRWRRGDVRSPNYRPTLCYDIETPSGNIIEPPENGWRWSEETLKQKISTGEIIFNEDETKIIRKIYLKDQEGRTPENVWEGEGYGTSRGANAELKELFNGEALFDTPKPTNLIKKMMELFHQEKNYIVLDFFAGSATTAQAVLDMNEEDDGNRQFICVQLPEPTDEDSAAFQAGYKTISDLAKERIRRAIGGYGEDKEPINDGFKVFKLDKSNYKVWEELEADEVTVDDIEEQLELFEDSLVDGYRELDVIYEVIIKEGYSLNATIQELDLEEVTIYKIEDDNGCFYITLDKDVSEDIVEKLDYDEETLFVCLDTALSDDSKINLSLRLNLKTI